MNVLLIGACGRMGAAVLELAGSSVVCGVDRVSKPLPFPLYQNVHDVCENFDVAIDFSSVEGLKERLFFCAEKKAGIVLGATGLSPADEALLNSYAEKIPVFQSGNLSLGANLLRRLAKEAARALSGFDAEIVERHHNKKKDAPSGTALMLAKSVNEGFGGEKENVYGRSGLTGERKKDEIGIHAVRGGTIVGEHEVMFAGEDEIFTLSHSARSRAIFANGALRAAEWLIGRPAGRYDMDDLLYDLTGG